MDNKEFAERLSVLNENIFNCIGESEELLNSPQFKAILSGNKKVTKEVTEFYNKKSDCDAIVDCDTYNSELSDISMLLKIIKKVK